MTILSSAKAKAPSAPSVHSVIPVNLPERPITWTRILCHVAFWTYHFQSIYNTMNIILSAAPPAPPDSGALWIAIADHQLLSMATFYFIALTSVRTIMIELLYQRVRHQTNYLTILKVGLVLTLSITIQGINDYILFDYLYHQTPHPSDYVQKWYGRLTENGPFGVLINYDITQFVIAYNFSYVLVPLLIKIIREALGWGEFSYLTGVENHQITLKQLRDLKYQINPHFLFNNFTSIYALIYKTNPEAARRLSGLTNILRYTLYETSSPLVPLRGELEFMSNLINLERSRRVDPERIRYTQTGDSGKFLVPPLLMATFIENAFKHGLDVYEISGWVTIDLQIDALKKRLHLVVTNPIPISHNSHPVGETKLGGLGLNFARQQLSKSFEPGEYQLSFQNEKNYIVTLNIPLRDA